MAKFVRRWASQVARNELSFYDLHLKTPVDKTISQGAQATRYAFVGIVVAAVTAFTAFECAHITVERACLVPSKPSTDSKWEWEQEEPDGWSTEGTDPALGLLGRHAYRLAWMFDHWMTTDVVANFKDPTSGSVVVVPSDVMRQRYFLKYVLGIAEERQGKLKHKTWIDLLQRYATTLELMGPHFLPEARTEYERLWAAVGGKGPDAARVALKLGDMEHKLGRGDSALAWWTRAIDLSTGTLAHTAEPVVPSQVPSSPLSQRRLASALTSVSAHYATSHQLSKARQIEEASLNLLHTIPPAPPSASAAQALHKMYILHHSSILSVHLAEVMYAQKQKNAATSLKRLESVAELSEGILRGVTGHDFKAPMADVLPAYTESNSLTRASMNLLRNTRRTSAMALNSMGMLHEQMKTRPPAALDCYQRALYWAGTVDQSGEWMPLPQTLQGEWDRIWGNYSRLGPTS